MVKYARTRIVRKKPSKKYTKTRRSLGKKLSKLSRFVYKTIEKKQVTSTFEVNVGSGVWTAVALTDFSFAVPPSQGTTNQQRVGNSLTLTNLNLRLNCMGLSNSFAMRCLIVQFPQRDGPPAITDVKNFLTYASVSASDRYQATLSPYAIGSPVKFTILKDWLVRAGDSSVDTPNQNFNIVKKYNMNLRPKANVMEFQLTSLTGTIQPIPNKNQINLYMINDYDQATGVNVQVGGIIRKTYRDA